MTVKIDLNYLVELPEPENVDGLPYHDVRKFHAWLKKQEIKGSVGKQDWFGRFRVGSDYHPKGIVNRLTKAIREVL